MSTKNSTHSSPAKHLSELIEHSKQFWRFAHFKPLLKRYGLMFVVIIISWELFEDVALPSLFAWLGHNLHPFFYSLVILPWMFCVGPLAVPVLWFSYCKLVKKDAGDPDEIKKAIGH